jgi:serine/threonine protein kinase
MGEVYRARDPRLGRDVAIKVLPEAFMRDARRLARFDREARALAALNHPNIGAIYGLEENHHRRGLVLELVEGQTLAEVMAARGAAGLPVPEVIAIARQIADALEAAHEKAIVHRDLKPANIKVTPSGTVKVLDFGLAKSDPGSSATQPTVTIARDATEDGLVVGTPRYMSPEQARGEAVGPQTDIWAFGCVLFELLAARPAFKGLSGADALVAVLESHPTWSELPHTTPPAVGRLLRRCLEKELRRRLHHIGDARLDLDDASSGGASSSGAMAAIGHARDISVRRLTDSVGIKMSPTISPDGKMVAYTALAGGHRQIFVQLIAGGAPLQVTREPRDHENPRWDADSSRMVYYSTSRSRSDGGSLWEVSAFGGMARRITSAASGADVSHDGQRLAFFRRVANRTELIVSARDGSNARTRLSFPNERETYLSPRWSPVDRAISFSRASMSFETVLFVVPVDQGDTCDVARSTWIRGHAWSPDGRGLIYSTSRGDTMPYPPRNNLRTINLDGTGDRSLTFGDASLHEPDVHPSGRLAVTRSIGRSDIWCFPCGGTAIENVRNARRVTRQTGQVQAPSSSPDGNAIAYISDHGGHSNVWVLESGEARQVTFEQDPETVIGIASWSPRGDWLVFIRAYRRKMELHLIAPDGGESRLLIENAFGAYWSADGQWVYCTQDADIVRINVDDGRVETVRRDSLAPTVSKDGETIYVSRMTTDAASGRTKWEIHRAQPLDHQSDVIGVIEGTRLPLAPRFSPHFDLSPDGRWLVSPLTDGETTNLWAFPTDGGTPWQITDFGDRAVTIARWASWSPDGTSLFAAVAEADLDVVMLDGLL